MNQLWRKQPTNRLRRGLIPRRPGESASVLVATEFFPKPLSAGIVESVLASHSQMGSLDSHLLEDNVSEVVNTTAVPDSGVTTSAISEASVAVLSTAGAVLMLSGVATNTVSATDTAGATFAALSWLNEQLSVSDTQEGAIVGYSTLAEGIAATAQPLASMVVYRSLDALITLSDVNQAGSSGQGMLFEAVDPSDLWAGARMSTADLAERVALVDYPWWAPDHMSTDSRYVSRASTLSPSRSKGPLISRARHKKNNNYTSRLT